MNVGTGRNTPTGDPSGPDGEVALDIEIAGAIAPAAKIAVYFAPNSDAGFIQAVNAAVNDTTNKPSVISISWGGPEAIWQAQSAQAFHRVLQAAAAQGITVCAASGDSGSGDGLQDGADHVDFPHRFPYVLGCGGTQLDALPGQGIRSEVTWNDEAAGGGAGGGRQHAVRPAGVAAGAETHARRWQQRTAREAGRAGCGGRRVAADGLRSVDRGHGHGDGRHERGRAAVGRVDCADQCGGECGGGRCDCRLDQSGALQESALRDITQGSNGTYAAAQGWDACTGLGSPNGAQLAAILTRKPSS